MIVGIPKGLLYYKYHPFVETFFNELDVEIITSCDTNKNILNDGVKYCVDEACLPIKVFHGHVAAIKDKCDLLIIPRIMQLMPKEYICPKFCGLPEMIINSISEMPKIIDYPIYADSEDHLYKWAKKAGNMITKDRKKIKKAFDTALQVQKNFKCGVKDTNFNINIALVGHPYNIYDNYINMNLIKKLNMLGVGIITEEFVDKEYIEEEVTNLFKKPFWTFAKNSYGSSVYLTKNKKIDGIIYISSFACGIDSILIELIKEQTENMSLLILKIDEQTGEAGFDTRLEAFVDMLERRKYLESNISTFGKHVPCS